MIVVAATNRPDILDAALLRARRFDRQVYDAVPDIIRGREQILNVHMRKDPDRAGRQVLRGHRPRHAWHERCRPGQPLKRGRADGRAPQRPRGREMQDFEKAKDKIPYGP